MVQKKTSLRENVYFMDLQAYRKCVSRQASKNTHGGTEDDAALTIGVSRSRAVVYNGEVLNLICLLSKQFMKMPSGDEIDSVEAEFYSVAGFPGVVGAIDGTLIKIPMPKDPEGWVCRKGYAAVNVQAVVDAKGAFRSLTICAGSANDQSVWNGSGLQKRLLECIPSGKHLIGDAGYKIWRHLLTPYWEAEALANPQKKNYNKAHSRTRMTVERAFGRLKNRFRALLSTVEIKSIERKCKLIQACTILHNVLLFANDLCHIEGVDPLHGEVGHTYDDFTTNPEQPISHLQGKNKRDDIAALLAGHYVL